MGSPTGEEVHALLQTLIAHRHCVHTPASQSASEAIAKASGKGSVHFTGSYLGFAPIHEAAIASAERAAAAVTG